MLENRAEVWFSRPEEINDKSLLEKYKSFLSPEELEKYKRFRFDKDRHTYLIAHALLRVMLSKYINCTPCKISFMENEYGKPEILHENSGGFGSIAGSPIKFNLSHTSNLVACVVTSAQSCGIDVEAIKNMGNTLELAENFFSSKEIMDLELIKDAKNADEYFFKLWTLKESYIKAKGIGLSLPLDLFAFRVGNGGNISIEFSDSLDDFASLWQFDLKHLGENHYIAVSIEKGKFNEYEIEYNQVIPLE